MLSIRIACMLIFTSAIMGFELRAQSDTLICTGSGAAPCNYVTGWYAGSGTQMELALHPELVKRRVESDTKVASVSYSWMIDAAANCKGCIPNVEAGRLDITILDETDSIASARVLSNDFFDYLHLVKFNGIWKVFNVVWDYYNCDSADSTKLNSVLEKYVEYWRTGDDGQLAGLIHPAYSGGVAWSHTNAYRVNKSEFLALIAPNAAYYSGIDIEYEILDIYLNTASVKIKVNDSVEYLHLSYQNDEWLIINALRNFNFELERN